MSSYLLHSSLKGFKVRVVDVCAQRKLTGVSGSLFKPDCKKLRKMKKLV